jgi:putative aldouronate transport system permease protein
MLSPSNGIVNDMIMATGHDSIYFMGSNDWFRGVLVTSAIWRDMGYNTVIYIAAIAGVDVELYEAAGIDGAGGWAKLWHITLPSIRNTIATVLLLTVSRVLQIFEQVLVMYNDGVIAVSDVLRTFNYREALLNNQIGYGTAIGLFTSVVSLILILGCNAFSRAVLKEEII